MPAAIEDRTRPADPLPVDVEFGRPSLSTPPGSWCRRRPPPARPGRAPGGGDREADDRRGTAPVRLTRAPVDVGFADNPSCQTTRKFIPSKATAGGAASRASRRSRWGCLTRPGRRRSSRPGPVDVYPTSAEVLTDQVTGAIEGDRRATWWATRGGDGKPARPTTAPASDSLGGRRCR